MGYYTSYNLTLLDPNDMTEIKAPRIISKVVALLKERGVIGDALCEDLSCHDSVKWYEYESDLLAVSKEVPGVLFRLCGSGDNAEDLWTQYFLNEEVQCCRAEIPPFDPTKLERKND